MMEKLKFLDFKGQRKEADGITKICDYLINKKGIKPSEILILLRSDRNGIFSNVIIESLIAKRIPVSLLSNPFEALETNEGSYLISILRLIVDRNDNLAWRNVLKVRRNNIGEVKFSKIYKLALEKGIEFYEVVYALKDDPELISDVGNLVNNELIEIEGLIDELTDKFDYKSPDNLSALVENLSNDLIANEKIKNEVIKIFNKIIESNNGIELETLLNTINVSLSDKEQDSNDGNVSIMTMHQAKGLTADAVFVAAAENEYIPGRAINEEEIGDARRLLYVSLTRARNYLYITHCQQRTGAQKHSGSTSGNTRRTLSRFLSGGPIKSIPADDYINNLTS